MSNFELENKLEQHLTANLITDVLNFKNIIEPRNENSLC